MIGHKLFEADVVQIGFYFVASCECGHRFQRTSLGQVVEAHRGHVHVEEARAAMRHDEEGDPEG